MKIAAVRTYLTFGGWRNWGFVQVETDEGLTGLGEATLEGKEQTIAAACLHLAACLPHFLFLETPLDLGAPWRKELLTEPLETLMDGYYELPTQPGLGIELNMEVMKAHPYQPVDMRMFG